MEENELKDEELKKCQYCAELIRKDAIKCRYCGSMLNERRFNLDFLSSPGYWHRVNEGKKIAGVCTGIAHQLNAPILILPLRLFFILTIPFYGFGIILYAILWALMPPPVDQNRPGTQSGAAPGGGNKDFEYTEESVPPAESTPTEPKPDQDKTAVEASSHGRMERVLVLFYGLLGINAVIVMLTPELFPMMREIGFTLLAGMACVPFAWSLRRRAGHSLTASTSPEP